MKLPAPTYPHATDPPLGWCRGRYDPMPVRFTGLGHPAAPRSGWPVYRCLDCGDELYHAERTPDEETKIRNLAEAAAGHPGRNV